MPVLNTIRDIGVTVRQILAEAGAQVSLPELLETIVGINRQVVDDTLAGQYANQAVDILFTGLLQSSVLDSASVKVSILNELAKFNVPLGLLSTLKAFAINGALTGVSLPAYLRVDRVAQAVSGSGVLNVLTGVLRQSFGAGPTTVTVNAGTNVTVSGGSFVVNSVAAGDILELNDVNNGTTLRRFRVTANILATSFDLETLDPDGVGGLPALATGAQTNVRVFQPTYQFQDANALFLANRTRPIDDALGVGLKTYPQPGDTLSVPSTFKGLYAFVDFKPLVGAAAIWRIKSWVLDTELALDQVSSGAVWAGPPLFSTTGIRYEVRTEEPATGRIPGGIADVYETFRALRKDLLGVPRLVQGPVDAAEVFGPAVQENPLGLAMFIATSINTELQVMGVQIEADTPVGHAVAIDAIAREEDPYYIVPLTSRVDVVSLYQAHVDLMSAPEERHERVCAVHLPIPSRAVKHDYGNAVAITVVAGTPNTITVTGATFLTDGTIPGDRIELKHTATPFPLRQFVITHVVSQTKVEVGAGGTALNPDALGALVTGSYDGLKVVTADFNADQKVNALVSAAQGFHDRRVAFVQPDHVVLSPNGVDFVVDGSYLAVAICAMYTINEPGKPLSRVDIPLIKSVSGSNSQFRPSQLRTLTSAGVMVVVQDSNLAPPQIRHEVCTDVDDKKVQQWSFTHVGDSLARAFRHGLTPMLGHDRLTDEFISKINTAVFAILKFYRDTKKRISAFTIDIIGISESIPDALAVQLHVTIPNVANNVDITMIL